MQTALADNEDLLREELQRKENLERVRHREYWAPLRKELENWRRRR